MEKSNFKYRLIFYGLLILAGIALIVCSTSYEMTSISQFGNIEYDKVKNNGMFISGIVICSLTILALIVEALLARIKVLENRYNKITKNK